MKRILSLILAVVSMLSLVVFVGCGGCEHEWESATCTTEKICKLCQETSGEPLGHDYLETVMDATCTSQGYTIKFCRRCDDESKINYTAALGHNIINWECENCDKNFGTWEQTFYVDQFNEYTSEKYIRNKEYVVGSFSNSATTNSKLNVMFLIDVDSIALKLWEYGSLLVTDYKTTYYDIIIRPEGGDDIYLTGCIYKGGDRIYILDSYEYMVLNALSNYDKVSFYLEEDDTVSSVYLFTVETTNFLDVYNSTFISN